MSGAIVCLCGDLHYIEWRESCVRARLRACSVTVLAVIPARIGATRLPRKPLRLLGGSPLVIRVWERVTAMGTADRCVIATDSREIAEAARIAGAECVMTREDHPSGTDRVAEAVEQAPYRSFRTVVNVQGDEPFVDADAVAGAAAMVTERGFELGTAAGRAQKTILDDPNVVKVVTADDGRAMYFSRAAIPHLRDPGDDQARSPLVLQHIGVYAYTRAALRRWVELPVHPLERVERLEQLRPLAAGMTMGVAILAGVPAPGIDTEDDLAHANVRWSGSMEGRS